MTTPEQAAARICRVVEPAVVAELDRARANLLGRLGPLKRWIVTDHWDAIELECRRVVEAAITAACREAGTMTVNDAVARILGDL